MKKIILITVLLFTFICTTANAAINNVFTKTSPLILKPTSISAMLFPRLGLFPVKLRNIGARQKTADEEEQKRYQNSRSTSRPTTTPSRTSTTRVSPSTTPRRTTPTRNVTRTNARNSITHSVRSTSRSSVGNVTRTSVGNTSSSSNRGSSRSSVVRRSSAPKLRYTRSTPSRSSLPTTTHTASVRNTIRNSRNARAASITSNRHTYSSSTSAAIETRRRIASSGRENNIASARVINNSSATARNKLRYTISRHRPRSVETPYRPRSVTEERASNVHLTGGNVRITHPRQSHRISTGVCHTSAYRRLDRLWHRRHIHGRDCRHFYHDGRWYNLPCCHVHRPGCGHVFVCGRWAVAQPQVVVVPVTVYEPYVVEYPEYETIEVYYPEEPRIIYPEYLTKGETEEEIVVKTLRLSTVEAKRIETLLQKEVIQSILADIPEEYEATFEYRPASNQLILTAPLEIVLKIETLIQDEKTFHYFVEKELDDKLVIAIISVVHPLFLEKDYSRAIQVATENYEAVSKLLQSLDRDYQQADKDCWLNPTIGTITIVDEEKNILAAYGYIDRLPYIPEDFIDP